MDNSKARIVVSGVVQGVFFRVFAQEKADSLGLKGFAKNLPSGKEVEVIAVGPKKDIETLIELLKKGPEMAVVKNVKVTWLDSIEKKYERFYIERDLL